mgnify:CR=1 FL=1
MNEMFSLNDILDQDETILWQGKPQKFSYTINSIKPLLLFGIIWLLFDGAMILFMTFSGAFSEMPLEVMIVLIVFFAVHLLPVWMLVSKIIKVSKEASSLLYIITDKRLIIKKGEGLEYSSINYKDSSEVQVKISGIFKKVGTISIENAFYDGIFQFEYIQKPVEIYRIIKKQMEKEKV